MRPEATTLTASTYQSPADAPDVAPAPRLSLKRLEAAAALGISPRKLSELTSTNAIPHVRLGGCVLFPVHELREWLSQHTEGASR